MLWFGDGATYIYTSNQLTKSSKIDNRSREDGHGDDKRHECRQSERGM